MTTVIFQGPNSINLAAALSADTEVVGGSPTELVVTDPVTGITTTFIGTFSNPDADGVPQSGTITQIHFVQNSSSVTVTTSISVATFRSFIDAEDLNGLFATIFAGADTVNGGVGGDQISTYADNDLIFLGGGGDTVNAGEGNDTVVLDRFMQPSVLFGGGGFDTLRLTPEAAITVNGLASIFGQTSTINGFERLQFTGTASSDYVAFFTAAQLNGFSTLQGSAAVDTALGLLPTGGGTFTLDPFNLVGWTVDDMVGLLVGGGEGDYTLNASNHSIGWYYLGGGAGNDTLNGSNGADWLVAGGGTNSVLGQGGDDLIVTGFGADTINAGTGNDQIDVVGTALGGTSINGGAGFDTLEFALAAMENRGDGLMVHGEDLEISGMEVLDFENDVGGTLVVQLRYDQLAGVKRLKMDGDGVSDQLRILVPTGGGTFTLMPFTIIGGSADDRVILDVGTGAGNYTLNSAAHTGVYVLNGGGGDDRLTGNAGTEILQGNGGDDVLNGKGGDDTLDGGDDIDTVSYYGTAAAVSVRLNTHEAQDTGGAGIDTLLWIENLTGANFDDTLIGNSLDNVLNGMAGADTMRGLAGNDIYIVNSSGDDVQEDSGQGTDTVRSYIGYTLGDDVENLNLLGDGTSYGLGNGLSNIIVGNNGANLLKGFIGNDVLRGNVGADKLWGGEGRDFLYGGVDNDVDTFVFEAREHSPDSALRDVIYEFVGGTDLIDLRLIDAKESLAGNQLFAFSNSGAAANSVWVVDSGADLLVYADTTGDTTADFSILVKNVASMAGTDFLL